MPGQKYDTQTSNQSRQPWREALPALRGILGDVGTMADTAGLTSTETGTLDALAANARLGSPYAPRFDALAGDLLQGGTDRTGLVNDAYGRLQAQLGATAGGDYLDPNKNPFFARTTQKIATDVQDRVNAMFAKAGRDLSGANVGEVARRVTEGVAPLYSDIYNRERGNQLDAIKALSSGGNAAAGLLSNLDQLALQNRQAGVGVGNVALTAQNYGLNQLLEIEAKRRGIPLNELTGLAGIVTPMAGLGGTTSGNTTSTSTTFNPLSLVTGSASGGPAAWLMSLSDARVKDNLAPIGALYDGTPVYSFNYIGDRTPRMGLVAQDVERSRPDAVASVGGVKAVDYGKATQRARRIGGLLDKIGYRETVGRL